MKLTPEMLELLRDLTTEQFQGLRNLAVLDDSYGTETDLTVSPSGQVEFRCPSGEVWRFDLEEVEGEEDTKEIPCTLDGSSQIFYLTYGELLDKLEE